jgi:hypothetical protein
MQKFRKKHYSSELYDQNSVTKGGIKMENQTHLNAVGEITGILYEAKEAANDEPAV